MKIYFEEKQYARAKALGLRDDEITFILGISTYKIQDFKKQMDYFEFDCEYEDREDHPVVKRFKKRIKKLWMNGS